MTAFDEYYDMYGGHFSKKLYEFAVSMMTDRNGSSVPVMTKEQVSEWMRSNGVSLKNDKGHDAAYVRAMLFSDNWGSSYTTDQQLALGVKDYLDDIDGYPEKAFDAFVMKCRAKRIPIFFEEYL